MLRLTETGPTGLHEPVGRFGKPMESGSVDQALIAFKKDIGSNDSQELDTCCSSIGL